MRAFTMDMDFNALQYDVQKQKYKSGWKPFLQMKRDYTCTCMCCNRPAMEVHTDYSSVNKTVGYIKDIFQCCDYKFGIYEGVNVDPTFTVEGSCCQCGIHCHCPCGPCERISFDVIEQNSGNKVGEIVKVWSGCVKEMFSNADNYAVTFPLTATWTQKSLLLACALFMDYRYFEESTDGKKSMG